MKMIFAGLVLITLTGCAAVRDVGVPVKIAVPEKCRAEMPQRPVMPTEHLPLDAKLFDKVRAALAEIDFREGYEVELVAALKSCY